MYEDIKEKFCEAEIILDKSQLVKMDILIDFLTQYNQKVNLTAIKDREGIIEKHLVDSILPLKLYELLEGANCLDIGTGAGFPAVPMMIFRPDLRFTLLDARRKRTDYLKLLVSKLNVNPREIVHGRAEELGRSDKYKEKYDMVTARAVSDLGTLFSYAAPLLKKGGVFMAMRGAKEEMSREVLSLSDGMGLLFDREVEYELPSGDKRRLITFLKV